MKSDFTTTQIETVITKESDDSVPFPSVTVCPLNLVHCTNAHQVINDLMASNSTEHLFSLCLLYTIGNCYTASRANQLFRYLQ